MHRAANFVLSGQADYTPREFVLLGIVLAAGVAARLWTLSHSAVEHFDEGVYASNLYFGPPDYAYPQQRFYAPPLLAALIEAGMIAGLPPNLAALLPSFLAGCGTIALLWWFGRSWFGPEVGLAAAALVALNDFHIAFSATALTDVLLGLWLVLAVDAIGRSLVAGTVIGTLRVPSSAGPAEPSKRAKSRRDDPRSDGTRSVPTTLSTQSVPATYLWAAIGGLYTGLAWWTKYNGWLPLAIEAAALPLLWLFLRPPTKQLRSWLKCLAITTLVAAALWSPYFLSLRSHGGYGPIAANHAKYVVGVGGWFNSAGRQLSSQFAIESGWSYLGLVVALFVSKLLEPRGFVPTALLFLWCFLGAIAVMALTVLFPLGVGATFGIALAFVEFHRAPKWDAYWTRRAIGLFLVATWWLAMLLATPLYVPDLRLALPCLLATWVGFSLAVPGLMGEDPSGEQQAGPGWGCVFFAYLICASLCLQAVQPHDDSRQLPQDRRGLLRIAQAVRATDIRVGERVIYVFGEPALYFQLRAAGEELVSPIQELPTAAATLEGQPLPTFLIAGPHANRDPEFVRQFAAASDRWKLVHEFAYQPSAIVWLDLNDPRRSPKESENDDRVRLYQLRP